MPREASALLRRRDLSVGTTVIDRWRIGSPACSPMLFSTAARHR